MTEYQDVYVTNTFKHGPNGHTAGNIYSVTPENAAEFIAAGNAEPVALGTLSTIQQTARQITQAYTAKRKELQRSERYDENETERAYLIAELDAETERAIEAERFAYKAELAAIKQFHASESLKTVGTPEEVEQANATVEAIRTQLIIADSPADVLELVGLKAATATDAERIAILKIMPEIEAAAGSVEKWKLDAVKSDLRKFGGATDHLRKLKHARAVEAAGTTAGFEFKQARMMQELADRRRKDGGLTV